MANPSAEGPSGAGTEVLRRKYLEWSAAANNEVLITGAANHIYTILSITFAERAGGASELMSMFVVHSGPVNIHIFTNQEIGGYETFVWNDRFCIAGDDILKCGTNSASTFDVLCTYIDQQF